MPYENFYPDNQFKDEDTSSNLQDDEKQNIETYTKGLSYTDQATAEFLNQLNHIDRPITVVFYGDHLPGIYPRHIPAKIIFLVCMKLIISSGLTMLRNRQAPNWMMPPVPTHHQIISPLS